MKVWLLTHTEELKKTSGTGKIVKDVLGDQCEIVEWSRVHPCEKILNLSPSDSILIYLCNHDEQKFYGDLATSINNIILLDGTWQQAQKMYNRSSYLHKFKHYEIHGIKSVYNKRRNQKNTGLCTAEVCIHLLKEYKLPTADTLLNRFIEFNQ